MLNWLYRPQRSAIHPKLYIIDKKKKKRSNPKSKRKQTLARKCHELAQLTEASVFLKTACQESNKSFVYAADDLQYENMYLSRGLTKTSQATNENGKIGEDHCKASSAVVSTKNEECVKVCFTRGFIQHYNLLWCCRFVCWWSVWWRGPLHWEAWTYNGTNSSPGTFIRPEPLELAWTDNRGFRTKSSFPVTFFKPEPLGNS